MKTGPLLKVSVTTTPEAEDAVAELLGTLAGQVASIYNDVETGKATASVFLTQASSWGAAKRAALRAGLSRIADCGLDLGPGRVSARKVRPQDWAESWKRHFKPIVIGTALLVKPSWSKLKPKHGQALVVLDPGLSFGTGQHPTTRFCLEQLVKARATDAGQTFLDIGTGSGILGISAVKLGYSPVVAFDFDADAVRVARDNARANGVGRQLKLSREDLTRLPVRSPARHDVLCANLIYDLLLAERGRILARLKPSGTLVLAGILHTQFREVRQAYEGAGLKLVASQREREWESGVFRYACV